MGVFGPSPSAPAPHGMEESPARDASFSSGGPDGSPPTVAVIGTGFLGVRIVAELLLLGSDVAVYDRSLVYQGQQRAQAALDAAVTHVLEECASLLELEGLQKPGPEGLWRPLSSEGPRQARFCASVGDAARFAEMVIEAVPDDLAIKSQVFAEAVESASPGVLLATSTLSIPIAQLQAEVSSVLLHRKPRDNEEPGALVSPRVVGLRFLDPVVFVPFVEVTLTQAQLATKDKQDVLSMLSRWGKSAFSCDVQGAAEVKSSDSSKAAPLGGARFKFDQSLAQRQQVAEARLRRARRAGMEALAALTPADLFDFSEDWCCICLSVPPTVGSLSCGHVAVCETCAEKLKAGSKRCPICRARFIQAVDSLKRQLTPLSSRELDRVRGVTP